MRLEKNFNSKVFAIFLAVFAFLVSFPSFASAENCEDVSGWKNSTFSCDINFEDSGGAGLSTCEYRVVGQSNVPDWSDIEDAAVDCSGNGPVPFTAPVIVGSQWDCQFQGANGCWIQMRATDAVGNISDNSYYFNIDYTSPTVPANFRVEFSPNNTGVHTLRWDDSTDTGDSGIIGYDIQRSSDGGASWVDVITNQLVTSWQQNPALAQGNYTYRIKAKDRAANESDWSTVVVVVDKTAPTGTLSVLPTTPDWVNIGSPSVILNFSAEDTGGSFLRSVTFQRADFETID